MQATVLEPGHPSRQAAEAMIRAVYARAYGARIETFPALLAAVLDRRGHPACAAGLRSAETGFFSERYLDVPVERSIAGCAGAPVRRESVLEVTTLAAGRAGQLPALLDFVIERGRREAKQWGLFTATRALRRALLRRGFPLHLLAPARVQRSGDPQLWGSYYDTAPWVCAIPDPGSISLVGKPVRGAAVTGDVPVAAVA